MDTIIDRHDVQGIILSNYNQLGYYKARYLFFKFNNSNQARDMLGELNELVTTGAPWKSDVENSDAVDWPDATTNVSFTYDGLKKLGVPVHTLQSFPDEFIIGMRGRRDILGDDDSSSPEKWDKVWHQEIHLFVAITAPNDDQLENKYDEVVAISDKYDGVELLGGHAKAKGQDSSYYQEASALYDEQGQPTDKEHFGYSDGISNPFFKGMTSLDGDLIGGGKKSSKDKNGYGDPLKESTWEPLETGEFVLGYKDEADEWPVAPFPPLMSRNGSFLVYRKLHENIASFNSYVKEKGKNYPGGEEELSAKFAGRWKNGVPITSFPDESEANKLAERRSLALHQMAVAKTPEEKILAQKEYLEVNKHFTGFDYNDDIEGAKCPVGAHTRRVNPRGSLEFGADGAFETPSALADRRRIIRRGLPYGPSDATDDQGEHGIIFMTIQANIKRQFEFVQQQWVNYGNDFKLANDKDVLLGNHHDGQGRAVIQGDPKTGKCPHFLNEMPRFVDTRGGDYFFIPSLTALRLLAKGTIDPT
ncbi:MAG: hypothetical protein OCD76_22145 [Reichenbachiella sp.]